MLIGPVSCAFVPASGRGLLRRYRIGVRELAATAAYRELLDAMTDTGVEL